LNPIYVKFKFVHGYCCGTNSAAVHGIGPHNIVIDGTATTVRTQLQEAHSAIEEGKADIAGLFALSYLMDQGVVDKALEKSFFVTFLAGAFRSIRFGLGTLVDTLTLVNKFIASSIQDCYKALPSNYTLITC
jgi:hypothetical protein